MITAKCDGCSSVFDFEPTLDKYNDTDLVVDMWADLDEMLLCPKCSD